MYGFFFKGNCVNNPIDSTKWTLLLHAAFCKNSSVLDYLLKNGANPNKHKGKLLKIVVSLVSFFLSIPNSQAILYWLR